MYIKGYVHINENEAFLANVHIVKDIRFYAGELAGYMELANSDDIVIVKHHPAGTYNGQIVTQ